MNLETLADYVALYRKQVIESGLRRDVTDYVGSLPNMEENIVSLRETARKLCDQLVSIHRGDLPDALRKLFPDDPTPFTNKGYDEKLSALLSDTEVPQEGFYSTFITILRQLNADLDSNSEATETITEFISPYTQSGAHALGASRKAVLSVVFKDKSTIHVLDLFSKEIAKWNKMLPLYHQLIASTSPEAVDLLEVQNGSIDLVLGLDVKVALSLADLFNIGFVAWGSYISYQKLIAPISAGYFNNKRLLGMEVEREKLMLGNIEEVIKSAADEQSKAASERGAKVDNPPKVIEQVARLITRHILRGNDLKVLALPESDEAQTFDLEQARRTAEELRKASASARNAAKELPEAVMEMLLEHYVESLVSDQHEGERPPEAKPNKKKAAKA